MCTDARPSALLIDGRVPAPCPLHHVWNECVGAGRANEALRADWQAHFREAVEVLGARHVRFHGLFHDDMFVYRTEYGGGFADPNRLPEPVITFSYVDKVVDVILATGARPFVELGFMPRGLATQTETLFWWKAHCSPPVDMDAWVALVAATVEHWIERYGPEEVRRWPFEVWNEPNLVPKFWTGTRTEYFELYAATARALKAIDPGLKVGGPSTSVFVPDPRYAGEYHDTSQEAGTATAADPDELDWQPVWIGEFLDYCAARDVPIDFLSTHLYPTDYAADAMGAVNAITRHRDATHDDLVRMRELIAASPYPDAELHISEWSTSPSSRDSIHDTLFAATYIVRAFLKGAPLADSISYWTFTDVFEEGGAGLGPFHGGFGFVNEQGLHKPTFHAMAMLNRLGDTLLAQFEHGAITRSSATGAVSAIFANYPADMGRTGLVACDSYAQTRPLADRGPALRVRHRVAGLEPGRRFTLEVLDWDHGNVAEAWHGMGSPLNPTRAQVEELARAADALDRRTLAADADGVLEIDLDLAPWAVASLASPVEPAGRRPLVPELEARRHLVEPYPDLGSVPEEDRAAWRAPFGPAETWDVAATDEVVEGPHGPVPVRVYTPTAPAPEGGRPALIWMHGGAFLWGDLDMPEAHDTSLGLAGRADAVVISVDYRLCPIPPQLGGRPEERLDRDDEPITFPIPQDDCSAVLDAVRADAARLGLDPRRIALGGASAGATLAAATTLRAAAAGTPPWQLFLIYPMVHPQVPAPDTELAQALADAPASLQFDPGFHELVRSMTLPRPGTAPGDAHPALSPDLPLLPPTYVENCEFDAFRASGHLFAEQARAAGVDVVEVTRAGVPHGHLDLIGFAPAHATLDALAARLRETPETPTERPHP